MPASVRLLHLKQLSVIGEAVEPDLFILEKTASTRALCVLLLFAGGLWLLSCILPPRNQAIPPTETEVHGFACSYSLCATPFVVVFCVWLLYT